MSYTDRPEWDEQRRQEALEAHMALFPSCKICKHCLMNDDTVIRIGNDYYCDCCADIMTNEEMREAEDIE